MPQLGEIKLNKYRCKCIWHACIDCGNERWVRIQHGKPEYERCRHWKQRAGYDTKTGTKICSKCGERKPLTEFWERFSGIAGHAELCKECGSEHRKQYYLANIEKVKARVKLYRINNKEKILEKDRGRAPKRAQQKLERKYRCLTQAGGGVCKCVCCPETYIHALTLDHIKINGNEHRRLIKSHMHTWYEKNNYPEGFQTLCWTCQGVKETFRKMHHCSQGEADKLLKEWALSRHL